MDLSRIYLDLTCDICGVKYSQQKRVYLKAVWRNRCKNHRGNYKIVGDIVSGISEIRLIKRKIKSIKKNKCIDCLTPTYDKRCKPCSGKNRRVYNHNNKCLDCEKKIKPKSKRCLKCHNINQDKGKSSDRIKFNTSKEWKSIRESSFKRDDYTCQICKVRGSVKLHGHHIKSYKNHKKERLKLDNIITLCEKCHMKLHYKDFFKKKYKHLLCE